MALASAPDPGRRALLHGRIGVTDLQRPPWALVEPEFVEACTRCGECLNACPERVIVRGDGGFPTLDFAGGECTFCGDCVAACPSAALVPRRDPPWSWRAQIDARCLAMAGVVCLACRDACPEQAIRFPLAPGVVPPQLTAERCSGCGACLRVCPPGAIAMHLPDAAPR